MAAYCNHSTSIELNSYPIDANQTLEQHQCTWICGRIYWTLTEDGISRKIENAEAMALLRKYGLPKSRTVIVPNPKAVTGMML
jgi:hypothetical protein